MKLAHTSIDHKTVLISIVCSKSGNCFHGEPGLKSEIEERDLFPLAELFDDEQSFTEAMKLTRADTADVRRERNYNGTRAAMRLCLHLWRQPNPSAATFEELLNIIETLDRGDIARDVHIYFSKRHS